jgi:hypothetical protein
MLTQANLKQMTLPQLLTVPMDEINKWGQSGPKLRLFEERVERLRRAQAGPVPAEMLEQDDLLRRYGLDELVFIDDRGREVRATDKVVDLDTHTWVRAAICTGPATEMLIDGEVELCVATGLPIMTPEVVIHRNQAFWFDSETKFRSLADFFEFGINQRQRILDREAKRAEEEQALAVVGM